MKAVHSLDEQYEDTSVTVCVRTRPFNARECKMSENGSDALSSSSAIRVSTNGIVDVFEKGVPKKVENIPEKELQGKYHRFCFDAAFDSTVRQEDVYARIGRPVIVSSFQGFNNCIFAYGQTGSGKSYSMMGPENDYNEDPGIIPRLCEELFEEVEIRKRQQEEDNSQAAKSGAENNEPSIRHGVDVAIYVSYLEIYMERVRCLLNTAHHRHSPSSTPSSSLRVRQHPSLGVYVEGLKEIPVTSSEQLLQLMKAGNAQRRTAKTDMNDVSSRSHAVFSIQLIQKNIISTDKGNEILSELGSKINLVDLAGSEKAKSTATSGEQFKEGSQINKSLTTLGIVINTLAEASKGGKQKQTFVPYRNSTLTFLLKESLGGNSKTLMLATVSPSTMNASETLSTLRYADRAKAIVTRAFINETPGEKRIRELEEEVERLRNHIRNLEVLQRKTFTAPVLSDSTTEAAEGNRDGSIMEEERNDQNVLVMKSELSRAEELIQQFTRTTRDREIEASQVIESIRKQTTLHVTRREPYILNIDGAGNWVMQYFVNENTYLTRQSPSLVGSETQPDVVEGENVTWICIPDELSDGVGAPHCLFIKKGNGNMFIKCLSVGSSTTYVNGELVGDRERFLDSGDVITIGDELLQFRFMDPSAPPPTGRRRHAQTSRDIFSPREKPFSSPTNNNDPTGRTSVGHVNQSIQIGKVIGTSNAHAIPLSSRVHSNQNSNSNQLGQASMNGSGSITAPSLFRKGMPLVIPQSSAFSPTTHKSTPGGNTSARSSSVPRSLRPSSQQRSSTPSAGSRRRAATPSSSSVGGGLRTTSDQKILQCRYNYAFLGPAVTGKSYAITNLRRPDKWYNFLLNEVINHEPTWGIQVVPFAPENDASIKLRFIELAGTSAFSALSDQLPVSHVTYVICFPLHLPHAEIIKSTLDTILYHAGRDTISVVLFGTHMDMITCTKEVLQHIFIKAEEILIQHVEASHIQVDLAIIGKFGLDNLNRKVVSAAYSNISKFSELLQWMMDQAVHQCKADKDFPNSYVPRRCIKLEQKLVSYVSFLKWFLWHDEYVRVANAVCDEYRTDEEMFQRDTELLNQWGVLYTVRSEYSSRDFVVIDRGWVANVLAVMALCQPFMLSNGVIETDIIPCNNSYGLLALSKEALGRFAAHLPFDPDQVARADEFGLLNHGVATLSVLNTLFLRLKKEKPPTTIHDIVEFLRSSFWLFPGSKLLFPHAWTPSSVLSSNSEPQYSVGLLGGPSQEKEESFFVIPAAFSYPPSLAVSHYLTRFLLGPFFKIVYPMTAPNWFSKISVYLTSVVRAVYPGPSNPCQVSQAPMSPLTESHHVSGCAPVLTQIPSTPRFWEKALWLVGPRAARCFLTQAGNAVFVSFNTIDALDDEFVNIVLDSLSVLDNDLATAGDWNVLVQPFGGAHTLLGESEPEDVDYYHVEKCADIMHDIRQMMTYSPTSISSSQEFEMQMDGEERNSMEEDERIVAFMRNWEDTVDLDGLRKEITNQPDDKSTLRAFSKVFNKWQESLSFSLEVDQQELKGRALDMLVDALARLR